MISKIFILLVLVYSLPLVSWGKGVLCLTFDDRNFDQWTNAIPILARYNAHASFFPFGVLSSTELNKLQILYSAGHTIGSHSVGHSRVVSSLTKKIFPAQRFWITEVFPHKKSLGSVGIELKSFAYPYGEYDEKSNVFLSKQFNRLRGASFRNYTTNGVSLVSLNSAFVQKTSLLTDSFVPSVLVGEYYDTDIADLCKAVDRIASTDEVLILTSHGISHDATDINMKAEWLIALCEACQKGGVAMLGLDELPAPKRRKDCAFTVMFYGVVIAVVVCIRLRRRAVYG